MRRPHNLKKSATSLTKQLFLLSSVKTSGRFFQIFVAFSEKLDFTFRPYLYTWAQNVCPGWPVYEVKQPQEKWACDFHDDALPLSFQLQVAEVIF